MDIKLPENFDNVIKGKTRKPQASEWYFVEDDASNESRTNPINTKRTFFQRICSLKGRVLLFLLVTILGVGVIEVDWDATQHPKVIQEPEVGSVSGSVLTAEMLPDSKLGTPDRTIEDFLSKLESATAEKLGEVKEKEEMTEQIEVDREGEVGGSEVADQPQPFLQEPSEFSQEDSPPDLSPAQPKAESLSVEVAAEVAGEVASEVAVVKTAELANQNLTQGATPGALEAWIAADLADGGWDVSGITLPMLAQAQEHGMRTFRVVILDGKLYGRIEATNKMRLRGMSRVWYWVWGLLELLEKYPGQVPDVDMVMQVEDEPKVAKSVKFKPSKGGPARQVPYTLTGSLAQGSNPPPVIFSAVKSEGTLDLLWPLWTIWGEDVLGAGPKTGGFHDPPWEQTLPALVSAARASPWLTRSHAQAFWRGAARTSSLRDALIACANKPQFRVDASSVLHKLRSGRPISAADRLAHRYLVYLDGRSFSSAMLPMIPTGALVMLPSSPWITLHSRAFRHSGFFLPFDSRPAEVCRNITAIVEACEADPEQSAAKAKAAVDWAENNLSIEMQRQYMTSMLQAYSKLMKFTVTIGKGMKELGW
eukprot:CAMPEP_0196581682 /NCGR_PEP_ID=MMETSP1081-20130531/35021_1 /TAXON_ID=36882 /ORGANISM="Pyramimonas amylifera, Strain CCMP720" /LENGTH=592 /DNA_ID=CAMNT_0041902005 /DNA_START=123 /DNA_END=1898 /DNA_ORIENTATION=+